MSNFFHPFTIGNIFFIRLLYVYPLQKKKGYKNSVTGPRVLRPNEASPLIIAHTVGKTLFVASGDKQQKLPTGRLSLGRPFFPFLMFYFNFFVPFIFIFNISFSFSPYLFLFFLSSKNLQKQSEYHFFVQIFFKKARVLFS